MSSFKYAISSADEAPKSAPILLTGSICENLKKAAALGYNAIEVHTREDAAIDYAGIASAMKDTNTAISMVVTGRLFTQGRCNLIDDAPYVTTAAMEGMKRYIEIAARLNAGIIVGWAKGNIPAGGTRETYLDRLGGNLNILCELGKKSGVTVNLEVINRYEVNLFTTMAETRDFIRSYGLSNCYIHMDSFHMFIDEKDPFAALKDCGDLLGYLHVADYSRQYPGSGYMDFTRILKILDEINYKGYVSVECLPIPTKEEAAAKAIAHLKGCAASIG